MNTPNAKELQIYEITHRDTGEKRYQPATNAEDACKQAGWLIGNCYVVEVKPQRKPTAEYNETLKVRIPCQICPYRYAECIKPADEPCPVGTETPDFNEYLRHAAQANLCRYIGSELTKQDYHLHQKWLPLKAAIKELARKYPPATQNPS